MTCKYYHTKHLFLCFRRDQFMEELENEELNRELCALAVDDMFESWSPETQEQVLAEWNDWQHKPKSVYVFDQCGKEFTRSHDLKRHVQSLHSGVKEFTCDKCEKSIATRDILSRHKRIHEQKGRTSVMNVTKNLVERYALFTFVEL